MLNGRGNWVIYDYVHDTYDSFLEAVVRNSSYWSSLLYIPGVSKA